MRLGIGGRIVDGDHAGIAGRDRGAIAERRGEDRRPDIARRCRPRPATSVAEQGEGPVDIRRLAA